MEFLFGLYLFLAGIVMVVSGTMMIIAFVNIVKDWGK